MVEKIKVIEKSITYSGLFSFKELTKIINKSLKEKAYCKDELIVEERVHKTGKDIEIKHEFKKELTNQAKAVIEISYTIKGLVDVIGQKKGKKIKTNSGKITIKIESLLETDYDDKWQNKPGYVIFRSLLNMYVFNFYGKNWKSNITQDVGQIEQRIKGYLNLQKY